MSSKSGIKKRILSSKQSRHALVSAENRNAIAFELKAMQDDRGWTQTQLADRAGMKQAIISKYMNGYDNYSLTTLRRLGEAFDVALLVTYVPFSEFASRIADRSYESIAIVDAEHDTALRYDDGAFREATTEAIRVVSAMPVQGYTWTVGGISEPPDWFCEPDYPAAPPVIRRTDQEVGVGLSVGVS